MEHNYSTESHPLADAVKVKCSCGWFYTIELWEKGADIGRKAKQVFAGHILVAAQEQLFRDAILGRQPSLSQALKLEKQGLGTWAALERWEWSLPEINKLNREELMELYAFLNAA